MSKKDLIEHLRQRLASDPRWALRALIRIYQNQTTDEQSKDATIERNGSNPATAPASHDDGPAPSIPIQ